MSEELRPSASRVQQAIDQAGLAFTVVELPETTRSAQEAAKAIGCRVEQIAKSLVFEGKNSHEPVLVIARGSKRVDEARVGAHIGEPIAIADGDYVRLQTGFAIGGVPPLGHDRPLRTLIDEGLLDLEEIWAAAGTPFAVFKLTPVDLLRATGGEVLAIAYG